MLEKFKRNLIRRKLKKDKRKLLWEIWEINRKLKILDELDGKDKEKK